MSTAPKNDAQRQRILDAAWRCFRKRGFHRAGMQEICGEAGLSPGAVYRYFASKEAIIEAVAAMESERWTPMLGELSKSEDLPSAFVRIAETWMPPVDADRVDVALHMEVLAESQRSEGVGEIVRMSFRESQAAMQGAIERALQAGRIDPALDPGTAAALIIALIDGLRVRLLVDAQADRAALLAALEVLLRRYLQPPG